MKNVLFIFFLPLWIFLPSITFAADFQAKVIHIADGDTITVLNATNEQIKIRLNGIDCPEKTQAYGNKAKQFTKELVHGEMAFEKAPPNPFVFLQSDQFSWRINEIHIYG